MKKNLFIFGLVFFIIIISLSGIAYANTIGDTARTATAIDLLVNGGFESGDLSGWTVDPPLRYSPILDFDVYEGRYRIYINPADIGDLNMYQDVSLNGMIPENLSFAVQAHGRASTRAVYVIAQDDMGIPITDSKGNTLALTYILSQYPSIIGYSINLSDDVNIGIVWTYFSRDLKEDLKTVGGDPNDWNKAKKIRLKVITYYASTEGTSWDAFELKAAENMPPNSITNLHSSSGDTWINWTWNNPSDADFNYTMVYLNGSFQVNTSLNYYNATGLESWTEHTISTHTVDKSGNINASWVNATAKTTDTTPPIITSATANPEVIEANGTHNTVLNVTAWDESGIASVTLNLSAIGGSANQAMVNNSGVWQYITNTTKIGSFQLQVNVTDNAGNSNTSVSITLNAVDTTPPASITNLQNTSGETWINWTWKNPSDPDFNWTMVYLDGEWKVNTSKEYYNATGLSAWTEYTISTRTVDKSGNINATWVNATASTLEVLCGDVNNNGEVTISDAMLLANNVSYPNRGYIINELASDVNYDGRITISDAMLIANNVSFPSGKYILNCG